MTVRDRERGRGSVGRRHAERRATSVGANDDQPVQQHLAAPRSRIWANLVEDYVLIVEPQGRADQVAAAEDVAVRGGNQQLGATGSDRQRLC
jgi:hypothetical protein